MDFRYCFRTEGGAITLVPSNPVLLVLLQEKLSNSSEVGHGEIW